MAQVPKLWSKYVEEVDSEQQAWLNSFIKAPLRLPMPSELSYIWDKREAHPTHTLYILLFTVHCSLFPLSPPQPG